MECCELQLTDYEHSKVLIVPNLLVKTALNKKPSCSNCQLAGRRPLQNKDLRGREALERHARRATIILYLHLSIARDATLTIQFVLTNKSGYSTTLNPSKALHARPYGSNMLCFRHSRREIPRGYAVNAFFDWSRAWRNMPSI